VPVFKKFESLIQEIQKELELSAKSDFPQSLREPILYFLESSGKKIRPLLTIFACQAVGGSPRDAMPAALGIELFHDFTLIHDDIMDRDELRRGRHTIHKKWGEDTAILVGDALVGLAYERMLQSPDVHLSRVLNLFNETLIKVCEGQALDKEFEKRQQVSVDDYIDMITKKTAWLIRLSTQLGAILGGGTGEQVNAMTHFGNQLGIGFQIQDDWLDYVGEENSLGKQVGSDLKLDKKTYVTLKYQEIILKTPALKAKYPARLPDFASLSELKSALYELNIADDIQNLIDFYLTDALKSLESVQPLTENNQLYQLALALQKRQS
jgi:geranylgeranyl diphosphate synthase type II